MKALRGEWLDRAHAYYVDIWLRGTWRYARGWVSRLPEMLLWYATAGAWGGSNKMADTMLVRVRRGRFRELPPRRRQTWRGARVLADEVCGARATNPVDWFTGGCGSVETGWQRLDEVAGVGPKVASFFLRDLSFLRDYSNGNGGKAVAYRRTRRDRRWFERLPEEDQALFLPIDMRVHAEAKSRGVSWTIGRNDVTKIQGDAALHRCAAAEIVRWARVRGLDPRDLDMYWYELGTGDIREDGCPCYE